MPPISSRRIRFGEPTSSAPSGVIVAAFSPSPASCTAAAASWTIAFVVARRDSSERSKRGSSSSRPITSGASTRSASSSSSCPVSSPSSTTIVVPRHLPPWISTAAGRLEPTGAERRMETARLAAVPLRGRARQRESPKTVQLERIEALAIPPAWKEVWISPQAGAKLQATGVDKAGRRQYLYHAEFRARQEQAKFDKLVLFAERCPNFARRWRSTSSRSRSASEWTAAVAVRLINLGWFRVGGERYAKAHKTFGITTLRKGHVRVRGSGSRSAFAPSIVFSCRTVLVGHGARRRDEGAARRARRARLFRYGYKDELDNLGARRLNDYIREHHGRGVHGQGLPYLGRDAGCGDRAGRARAGGDRDGAEDAPSRR